LRANNLIFIAKIAKIATISGGRWRIVGANPGVNTVYKTSGFFGWQGENLNEIAAQAGRARHYFTDSYA
jgi:hypothetical protein